MLTQLNRVKQNAHSNLIVLRWPRELNDHFFEFCQVNKELRIERNAKGECEIMAPTGGTTSRRNSALIAQIYNWAEQEGTGIVFDATGGFILPNGAIRSPDVSWIKKERLAALTAKQKEHFLPLCPDFVVELRSPSDNLKTLQNKMQEYIENGASLGWLIECKKQQVFIFQHDKTMLKLDKPEYLLDNNLLNGFKLDMNKIWNIGF